MSDALDADVIIIGGGPAGSTLASLMAQGGRRALVIEKDIHPRDHVGEALTPSTNFVLDRIGVLPKLEVAGFFRKSGVGWTAPRSKPWRFLAVRTSDYPPPHAVQPYNVHPPPSEYHDFMFLHFLKLERAWAWHIPLRAGKFSMGVVTKKDDFTKSGKSEEDFFESFIQRNRTLATAMEGAERIRDWEIEGDYSYRMERFAGPGWLLIGDALRFVDPIFSSGVDVALYSAMFAHEALENVWSGGEEDRLFSDYEKRVTQGVDIWYELTDLFYRFQLLFTLFLVKRDHRAQMVRVLQGNPYLEDTQQTARSLIDRMWSFHEQMKDDEQSLFRPSALSGS